MPHEGSSAGAGSLGPGEAPARVLENAITRRLAGEDLPDEAIIAAHPKLMPDLGDMLLDLRRVEAARDRTTHSSEPWAADVALRMDHGESAARITTAPVGYEILHEIHHGGQGVVYQAIQGSTKREVAIKIMREGSFSGPSERARFQREVEMLARLNHPHIVAIHDSGVCDGCHYFVMDYVAGESLDQYVDRRMPPSDESSGTTQSEPRAQARAEQERRTSRNPNPAPIGIRDILNLFQAICEAVNAAHLRGIIHRDLKPSNIRVDESGKPRILDFGLAKLADDRLDQEPSSDVTLAGQFIGSLAWCSPEQAEGRPDKVDMRSDVYSLGVVLYRMLTGCLPHDVTGAARDVLDRVLRDPPVSPRKCNAAIDDEVETIVIKCLDKERDRRYQTAGELARDVHRYLNGEPIEAKRDSGWYVFRKTLRRYRVQTGIAVCFMLLIVGSAIALGFAFERARTEAQKAEATSTFLRDMLAAADPNNAKGNEVTVREVLDAAALQADGRLGHEPEVAAAVHRTLGQTYHSLGHFEAAERQYQAAFDIGRRHLGEQHPDTLDAENGVASAMEALNRYDEAEALFRRCLDATQRVKGTESPEALDVLHNLANLLRNRGKHEESQVLLEQSLEGSMRVLGPEHPSTLITRKVLAGLWQDMGQYDKAEPALREVLEIQRRVLGEKSPQTIGTLNNLAILLKARGRLDEAAPLYETIVGLEKEVHGPDHPQTLRHMNSYGRLLSAQGKLTEAEDVLRRTLEAQIRRLGEKHVDTIITTNNLALLLSDQGRLTESEPLARAALKRGRAVLGDEHPDTLVWMNNLANLLSRQGKTDKAEELYRKTLESRRRSLGEEHPQTLTSMSNLANQLLDRGELDEVESLHRHVLDVRTRLLGPTHYDTLLSMSNMVKTLLAGDRFTEAEPLAREALRSSQETLGSGHPLTLLIANNTAGVFAGLGLQDEAMRLLNESIATAERELPSGHVHRFFLHGTLGTLLVDAGKCDQAEPHLRQALDGLKQAFGAHHTKTRKVVAELIELYGAQGNEVQATALRKKFPASSQSVE